jgi:subtilisin family serine protease
MRWTLVVPVLLAITAGPAGAQAPTSARAKLDDALRARARQFTGRSRVIVEYRGAPDVRAINGARGVAGRQLAGGRLQIADLDNQQLDALAADTRIVRIVLDRDTFPTMERTGAAVGATTGRTDFGVTGRGVGVAVIDSGITRINEDVLLDANGNWSPAVVHYKDFTQDLGWPSWIPQIPNDPYGHGTHVAGIIRGSGYLSGGRRSGVAPGARLIGLRVLDDEGHGHISDVIDAIDYAISIKRTYNVRIINLSVGASVTSSYKVDPLTLATKRAVDAGIVVIAAAGNQGRNAAGDEQYGGITAPGNAPWVLTVGAESHNGTARRSDDSLAGFSSRGPTWLDFGAKPDIIAPGVGIESLTDWSTRLYHELPDYLLSGTRPRPYKPYLSLSGTSMAAPVVAGAVALMLEANPLLTPNAVKGILEYTAQDNAGVSPLEEGAGLLNVPGAIRMATFFRHPRTDVGMHADAIEGEVIPWSEQMIWGNYRITGGVLLPHSNAWNLSTRWGVLHSATGAPVVWGARDTDNIVWSTAAPNDDDNIVWSTAAPSDDDNIVWSTAAPAGGDDDHIVWSTAGVDNDNIVWSTSAPDNDNIVWSTHAPDDDNIVWSTAYARNVVWGRDCTSRDCRQVIRGARKYGVLYGTLADSDNIVWSTAAADNDNIVWSTAAPGDDDNIVWSTAAPYDDDNIVWSTAAPYDDDNIVWSTAAPESVLWAPPVINDRRRR